MCDAKHWSCFNQRPLRPQPQNWTRLHGNIMITNWAGSIIWELQRKHMQSHLIIWLNLKHHFRPDHFSTLNTDEKGNPAQISFSAELKTLQLTNSVCGKISLYFYASVLAQKSIWTLKKCVNRKDKQGKCFTKEVC